MLFFPDIISLAKRLDVSKNDNGVSKTVFMNRFRVVFQTFSLTKKSALPLYVHVHEDGEVKDSIHQKY